MRFTHLFSIACIAAAGLVTAVPGPAQAFGCLNTIHGTLHAMLDDFSSPKSLANIPAEVTQAFALHDAFQNCTAIFNAGFFATNNGEQFYNDADGMQAIKITAKHILQKLASKSAHKLITKLDGGALLLAVMDYFKHDWLTLAAHGATILALVVSVSAWPFVFPRTPQVGTSAVVDSRDFIDPRLGGGRMVDTREDWNPGTGEPLNVIISGKSSAEVLTEHGRLQYFQAIGYDRECLGQHSGVAQSANLGDGRGEMNETVRFPTMPKARGGRANICGNALQAVIRLRIGDVPVLGTCIESLSGGNHFRVFPQAGTNALFLATSKEEDLTGKHHIIPDGYNLGRDQLVDAAIGRHHGWDAKAFKENTYETQVVMLAGLVNPGWDGIHNEVPVDGLVALLTVRIVGDDDEEAPAPRQDVRTSGGVRSRRVLFF
ncbi:hypothetical protein MKEN_01112500 [Mycena kentingensis (nom. inval.)]|nr:hypothetical protein MKEN_01112500 [Mycena kentingensis (nom. inval.)]